MPYSTRKKYCLPTKLEYDPFLTLEGVHPDLLPELQRLLNLLLLDALDAQRLEAHAHGVRRDLKGAHALLAALLANLQEGNNNKRNGGIGGKNCKKKEVLNYLLSMSAPYERVVSIESF